MASLLTDQCKAHFRWPRSDYLRCLSLGTYLTVIALWVSISTFAVNLILFQQPTLWSATATYILMSELRAQLAEDSDELLYWYLAVVACCLLWPRFSSLTPYSDRLA